MFARKGLLLAGVTLLGLSGSAAMAESVTFFNFNTDPDYSSAPIEFSYSSTTGLSVGPGSSSDGTVFSPGLFGIITGGLSPATPAELGAPYVVPTYFLNDASLAFTAGSFAPDGAAIVGASDITQNLTGGTFTVKADNGAVLLTGTTASASLQRQISGSAGVLSGTVTYTGGILKDKLAAAGLLGTGSFSFSLSGLTGTYSVDGTGHLSSFGADGVGTFDATSVPTPAATFGGAALLGTLAVARVRRRAALQA